jgi:hypothetical protein
VQFAEAVVEAHFRDYGIDAHLIDGIFETAPQIMRHLPTGKGFRVLCRYGPHAPLQIDLAPAAAVFCRPPDTPGYA